MPTTSGVIIDIDATLGITRSNGLLPLIGVDSEFVDKPHPYTGNKIEGWKWDRRVWASELELNNIEFVPSIFDPVTDGITDDDILSGIGDNNDLKVIDIDLVYPSGQHLWVPRVYHGYYYDHSEENYLFSDDSVVDILPSGQTISGLDYAYLSFEPKSGIPVLAAKYEWDAVTGKYNYKYKLRKRTYFTGERDSGGIRKDTIDADGNLIHANIDSTLDEFIVDYINDPFKLYTSRDFIELHGIAPANGTLDELEQLGLSTGADNEEFHTKYSPVLSGLQIVSYYNVSGPYTSWTIVPSITASGQCEFDYDLGVVRFGEGVNFHPNAGESVAAFYKSSLAIEYEKKYGRNTIQGIEVDINPIKKSTENGFLFVKNHIIDPALIELTAETDLISPNFYGPVYLGSFVQLDALVKSITKDLVEGEDVTFTIENGIGSFTGGSSSITSTTSFDGIATTIFSAPRDISEIGGIGELVTLNSPSSGYTTIVLSGVNLTGDPSSWYIYKVFTDDPTLGVDSAKQYYLDYFSEQDISGPTADDLNDDGTGWENTHRLLTGLITPTVYGAAFRNGKKQLLCTYSTTAINPHTFTEGAFVPVRPTSYNVDSDGNIHVVVSGILDLPSAAVTSGINNRLAGYFVAGPTVATVQASVYNERLGTTIRSNEIELDLRVPPSMDGTPLIETMNAIEASGIFAGYVNPPTAGVLPLGFRFRSTGVTLAGVLDGLTYIDINPQSDVLAHTFTVVDSGVIR